MHYIYLRVYGTFERWKKLYTYQLCGYTYVSCRRIVKISLGKSNESDRIFTCVRMRVYHENMFHEGTSHSFRISYTIFSCKSISWNAEHACRAILLIFQLNVDTAVLINLTGFLKCLFLFREKVRFESINNYMFFMSNKIIINGWLKNNQIH